MCTLINDGIRRNQPAIIDKILLITGDIFVDIKIDENASKVPGFIAVRDRKYGDNTAYIALSSIAFIQIKDTEQENFNLSWYILPTKKEKVTN